MNRNHVTRKAASRALPPVAAAGARQSMLVAEEFDDMPESPMPPAPGDASDWPEQEGDGTAYLGAGNSEQTDDALAPEVETGINLLLHGVAYR